MNIQNLVFFKTDGTQIPTQYTHTLTFSIIGNMSERGDRGYGWRSDAKGFITLDEQECVEAMDITDGGSTYGFIEETDYTSAVYGLIDEIDIELKTDNYQTTAVLGKGEIVSKFDIEISKREVSYRASDTSSGNKIYEYFISKIAIKEAYRETFIKNLFQNLPSGMTLYPCQQFMNQVMMEKVSVELASTESIFVLEKRKNSKGEIGYFRPRSATQNLRFQFKEDSDTKIVKTAEEYYSTDVAVLNYDTDDLDNSKVYWSDFVHFNLRQEYAETEDSIEPLIFTLGFVSEYEGCFQDTLTMMTIEELDIDEPRRISNIGYFIIKNETVGEDERYRTLFTNFGIPDPKEYPNLFKDIESYEEGTDWDYINKKSKELFLSYHEIFPYVGTYKALLNAVKFLGYDDIYFKEWYKYFDGESEEKISYQSVDIDLMKPLQSKLARIGVSLEDFISWKKLSQLTMVYLLNTQTDDDEVLESYEWVDGKKTNISSKTFHIPSTKAVYTYLNSQILVKLNALKEWLENYILNINCQIIDVAAEGVYFERYKEQAYAAPLYTNITAVKEENITPVYSGTKGSLAQTLKFGEYAASVTTKELENNTKISDLSDKSIIDMIDKIEDVSYGKIITDDEHKNDVEYLNNHINWLADNVENYNEETIEKNTNISLQGAAVQNSTIFNDIQYELAVSVDSGAMKSGVGYWDEQETEEGGTEIVFVECPLIAKDNEVMIYGFRRKEIEFQKPPVIRITAGKLHRTFGHWGSNILYSVQGYFDTKRTKTRFAIQNTKTKTQLVSDDYITLYPRKGETVNPSFKYTEHNKYGVPMFVIEDYDTFEGFLAADSSVNKFILEIDEGYVDAFQLNDDENSCLARLKFEQDYDRNNANEQTIQMEYYYKTPRLGLEMEKRSNVADTSAYIVEFKKEVADYDQQTKDVSSLTYETAVYDRKSKNPLLSDVMLRELHDKYEEEISDASVILNRIERRIAKVQAQLSDAHPLYTKIYQNELVELENQKVIYQTAVEAADANARTEFGELKEKWIRYIALGKTSAVKRLFVKVEDARIRNASQNFQNSVKLNHVGDYTLKSIATDGFGLPYAKKSNKKFYLGMTAPTVFVNTYTEEGSDFDTVVEKADTRPWFLNEYFRNVKSVDRNEGSLLYEDFSYFTDSPKKNDFVHLSNTTERVTYIEEMFDPRDCSIEGFEYDENRSYVKIKMCDENPMNQNVFYIGAEIYLVYIDKNSCVMANYLDDEAVGKISAPYRVDAYYNPYLRLDEQTREYIITEDENEDDDNYLILSSDNADKNFVTLSKQMNELMKTNDVNCYAIVSTRLELEREYIENDIEKRRCVFKIKDKINGQNMAFKVGQCVKIEYSVLTYYGLGGEGVDNIKETYVGGAAYKITNAYFSFADFTQTYEIDGLINTDLIDLKTYKNGVYNDIGSVPSENIIGVPYGIKCTVAAAHSVYTSYDVMATDDADENNLEGYLKFKDDWFGTDYLDNTFALNTRNFKVYDAFDDWFSDFGEEEVLYAHSEPVTEYKDSAEDTVTVMVNSYDLTNSIENSEYCCIWDVYYNSGKDNQDEYLLYRLTNDQLTLKLRNDGEYRFQLTAIDKYGNSVTNKKQGFLKIVTRE